MVTGVILLNFIILLLVLPGRNWILTASAFKRQIACAGYYVHVQICSILQLKSVCYGLSLMSMILMNSIKFVLIKVFHLTVFIRVISNMQVLSLFFAVVQFG